MIVDHLKKKEQMLDHVETALKNNIKRNVNNITTTDSNTRLWLDFMFNFAYELGEMSGLLIAGNMVKHAGNEIKDVFDKGKEKIDTLPLINDPQ